MTEHYRGYSITLEQDQDADDPSRWTTPEERRTWCALRHRRYVLPFEIETETDDYDGWRELAEAVTGPGGELAGKVYRFVRWYEHGGVSVSLRNSDDFGDWDAGCAGVIFGESPAAISATFRDWKAYVEGDVYTAAITAPDGKDIDQLVGLYGYDEALACARWVIDADTKLTGVARVRRYGRVRAPRAQELHA